MPKTAIELAKRFEGFHRVLTVELGRRVEAHLARELITALDATLRCYQVLAAEPEGRLSAIVDFTFNLGTGRLRTSTLRRRIKQRDWVAAAQELRRRVYGGGKVLPGLRSRRDSEALLLSPV